MHVFLKLILNVSVGNKQAVKCIFNKIVLKLEFNKIAVEFSNVVQKYFIQIFYVPLKFIPFKLLTTLFLKNNCFH